jgi:hypothetical protein
LESVFLIIGGVLRREGTVYRGNRKRCVATYTNAEQCTRDICCMVLKRQLSTQLFIQCSHHVRTEARLVNDVGYQAW